MPRASPQPVISETVLLSALIAPARRLALVGLAKNTGKTQALAAILSELRAKDKLVGVTSVGRDGEERDVIDIRIEKPRLRLAANTLVATTDSLLRSSGIPYELLEDTGVRTPLGRVLIGRLEGTGTIEVAGPSAAQDVRAVSDAMLEHGAQQVLIDGAIDRRAASSPAVSDGLVISTGAVLNEDIQQVVAQTRDAVDLVCLPEVDDAQVRAVAVSHPGSFIVDQQGGVSALPARFLLTASAGDIAELLRANPGARHLIVPGALCEPFVEHLLVACRGHPLDLVVGDSTKVFLSHRGYDWYRRQGITIKVLCPIELKALTINPVAPQSHRFDSQHLRQLIEQAVADVHVLDVLDRAYLESPA
jgi:hypothetical protein